MRQSGHTSIEGLYLPMFPRLFLQSQLRNCVWVHLHRVLFSCFQQVFKQFYKFAMSQALVCLQKAYSQLSYPMSLLLHPCRNNIQTFLLILNKTQHQRNKTSLYFPEIHRTIAQIWQSLIKMVSTQFLRNEHSNSNHHRAITCCQQRIPDTWERTLHFQQVLKPERMPDRKLWDGGRGFRRFGHLKLVGLLDNSLDHLVQKQSNE